MHLYFILVRIKPIPSYSLPVEFSSGACIWPFLLYILIVRKQHTFNIWLHGGGGVHVIMPGPVRYENCAYTPTSTSPTTPLTHLPHLTHPSHTLLTPLSHHPLAPLSHPSHTSRALPFSGCHRPIKLAVFGPIPWNTFFPREIPIFCT